jgi:phosphoribosylglycinamide formyltransferase-1
MTTTGEPGSVLDKGIRGSMDPIVRSPEMARTFYRKGDRKPRIAVLVSGRGSDLQSLIDAMEKGEVDYEISIVISNNDNAFAIERAKNHYIPFKIIDHRGKERERFDSEIHELLKELEIDFVVLAGFMRVLSEWFVGRWEHRIINIHPSLLPSFPGAHAHRDVITYGVKVTGLTIHFVDEKMDHGPIIFQYPVKVEDDDTEETISIKVIEKEHEWYPRIVNNVVNGKYTIEGRKVTTSED